MTPPYRYRLAAKLKGHTGPVNCFSFARRGTILASGSDDETVRIWDLKTNACLQVIRDHGGRWGQITSVTWDALETGDMGATLYFGTGRGILIIYLKERSSVSMTELSSTNVFSAGDSVEAITYDTEHRRAALTSHYGHIKLFTVEQNGTMTALWNLEMERVIPRAIHFIDGHQNILVFAMESGTVSCHDAETGHASWTKMLKSAIGSASVCLKSKQILVDNLMSGFDLYHLNRASPLRTFAIPHTQKYVKQGAFGEGSTIVACGSDHGKVYVFKLGSPDILQTLMHCRTSTMVQAVKCASSPDSHLIASGPSGGQFEVCVWAKPVNQASESAIAPGRKRPDLFVVLNGIVLLFMLWVMSDLWKPILSDGMSFPTAFMWAQVNKIVDYIEDQRNIRRPYANYANYDGL